MAGVGSVALNERWNLVAVYVNKLYTQIKNSYSETLWNIYETIPPCLVLLEVVIVENSW